MKAATKAAKRWIDMDVIRVKKRRISEVDPRTPEDIAGERRRTVRMLVLHGEEGLRAGAERFGAVDCIYFVRMDGTDAYKIGYTFHLRQRLSAIGAGIPVPVRAVSWVSFYDERVLGEAEYRAHELASFYGERLKGEWFNLKDHHVRKIVDDLIEGLRDEVMGVSYNGSF